VNDTNQKSPTSLIIKEDKSGSIAVKGLREAEVKSLDKLMDVLSLV
jgi:hypothetical protein